MSSLLVYSRKVNRLKLLSVNKKYLYFCGLLFASYIVSLYISVGMVESRQQVIAIGLLNYLWPSLTILFSVFIFKFKTRIWLIPGLLLATLGVIIASIQGSSFSYQQILSNIEQNWLAYILAFCAAILWGLYSNLSRLWGKDSGAGGMPVFILATGIILLIVSLFVNERSNWDLKIITELLYMSIFPTFLGYQFWDKAMQKGDIILVASFSYFTPLLATIFACIYLDLNCSWMLWPACGLVLTGSIISKLSVRNSPEIIPQRK